MLTTYDTPDDAAGAASINTALLTPGTAPVDQSAALLQTSLMPVDQLSVLPRGANAVSGLSGAAIANGGAGPA